MIALSSLITISTIGFVVGAVKHNKLRSSREVAPELKPNCLLTRWPLLFVSGRKSLFYFQNYWNTVPSYLAQHGYEVFNLELPWRSRNKRIEALQGFFNEHRSGDFCVSKFHLQIDLSTSEELVTLLSKADFEAIASITLYCHVSEDARLAKLMNTLRGLKRPIEIIYLDAPTQSHFLHDGVWFLHRILTQNQSPSRRSTLAFCHGDHLGYIHEAFLARSVFLAERDLKLGDGLASTALSKKHSQGQDLAL